MSSDLDNVVFCENTNVDDNDDDNDDNADVDVDLFVLVLVRASKDGRMVLVALFIV